MAIQQTQTNQINLQWFQHQNLIIFKKYDDFCGDGLYNAIEKKLKKAGMNFTAWHQQPLND